MRRMAGSDHGLPVLLSDMWCHCAGSRCVHHGGLQDDLTHSGFEWLQLSQHAADQWHHHHLRVVPGLPGCSKGEQVSASDGMTHTFVFKKSESWAAGNGRHWSMNDIVLPNGFKFGVIRWPHGPLSN